MNNGWVSSNIISGRFVSCTVVYVLLIFKSNPYAHARKRARKHARKKRIGFYVLYWAHHFVILAADWL